MDKSNHEKRIKMKMRLYSLENLFCLFQCFHFKINRWHGIKDKINKDEKYTSVTKMVKNADTIF